MKLEDITKERMLSARPSDKREILDTARAMIGMGEYDRAGDLLEDIRDGEERAEALYLMTVSDILKGKRIDVAREKLDKAETAPYKLLYWTSNENEYMPDDVAEELRKEFSGSSDTKLWEDYCSCFCRLPKLREEVEDELKADINREYYRVKELFEDQAIKEREEQIEKTRRMCEERIEKRRMALWK